MGTNFQNRTNEGAQDFLKIQNDLIFVDNKPIIIRSNVLELVGYLYRITKKNHQVILYEDFN